VAAVVVAVMVAIVVVIALFRPRAPLWRGIIIAASLQ